MPRQKRKSIRARQVLEPISHPERVEVNARPVDTFIQPKVSTELTGLVKGLEHINPKIQSFALFEGRKQRRLSLEAGKIAAQRGEELKPGSNEYFIEGFQNQRGLVEGEKFGEELVTKYRTEFDKDSGDIEEFIRESTRHEVQGINDVNFGRGFTANQFKYIEAIRSEQAQYQRERITDRVEADSQFRLSNAYDAAKANGIPFSVELIDKHRKELGANFGIGNARFNDLLYNVIHEKGLDGDFKAYEILKKDRPDGTKGMYHIPKWKKIIDAAQVQSQKIHLANIDAKARREARLDDEEDDNKMLPVLLKGLENPAEGRKELKRLIDSGQFNNATQLSKYINLFDGVIDEDEEDGSAMRSLMVDILDPNKNVTFAQMAKTDLSVKQLKALQAFKISNDSARRAANNQEDKSTIYKTPEYKAGSDNIKGRLNPPVSFTEKFTERRRVARLIEENAQERYFKEASRVKDPAELDAIKENIVQDSLKLINEKTLQSNRVDAENIIYSTPQALKNAIDLGYVTNQEVIDSHVRFFKQRNLSKKLSDAEFQKRKAEREAKFK